MLSQIICNFGHLWAPTHVEQNAHLTRHVAGQVWVRPTGGNIDLGSMGTQTGDPNYHPRRQVPTLRIASTACMQRKKELN
jgi:hypothetical protein